MHRAWSALLSSCSLVAACGGATTTAPGTDGGHAGDSASALDTGTIVDSGANLDVTVVTDSGTPVEAAPCSDASGTQPAPVPLPSGTSCSADVEPLATWFLAGMSPSLYTMAVGSSMSCNGGQSLHLSSSTSNPQTFGTAMLEKSPAAWDGKRVRLSAWVMSSGVTGWAGLWMRVDSPQAMAVAFDNMQCRAISGTTGWAQYQVVLDVEHGFKDVAYGILLAGNGEVWIDGVSLDIVDDCVPTTACP